MGLWGTLCPNARTERKEKDAGGVFGDIVTMLTLALFNVVTSVVIFHLMS